MLAGRGTDFFFGNEQVDVSGTRIFTLPSHLDYNDSAEDSNPDTYDTVDYSDQGVLDFTPPDAITIATIGLSEEQIQAGFLVVTDDGQGGTDTLHSIERIIATDNNDQLITSNLSDLSLREIDFGDGNDVLRLTGGDEGGSEVSITGDSSLTIENLEALIGSTQDDFILLEAPETEEPGIFERLFLSLIHI